MAEDAGQSTTSGGERSSTAIPWRVDPVPRPLRRTLGRSVSALVIKVCSAALSLVMFVVLARVLAPGEFGTFAFAFSLASFLSLACGLGASTLVLRYIPMYLSDGDVASLRGLVIAGYAAVLCASGVVALICFGVGTAVDVGRDQQLAASGLLTVAMAAADYQSGVYRGLGSLYSALLPRDILWRAGVIVACLPALLGLGGLPFGGRMSAATALLITASILGTFVTVQIVVRPKIRRLVLGPVRPHFHPRTWSATTWGLWVNAVVQTGSQHLAIVILGVSVSATESGGIFAALRAAMLLNFFLLAANIVVAPQIARLWHENKPAELQRVCASVTLVAALPTVVGFVVYCVAGREILGLFGAGFRDYYWSLIVLSGAQVVNSLCGQTGVLMSMTGHERTLMWFVIASNVVPLALIPVGTTYLGPGFGALAVAAGMVMWNVQVAYWARRHLHIDTSILGVWPVLAKGFAR